MDKHDERTMDRALGRLERLYITARYFQIWWEYMPEEEKQVHLSRITEDLGNASQIAGYWTQFAHRNGITLPDDE